MVHDLSRLLRPRSIAVIGGGWGLAVAQQCQRMGFEGEIWPVHPSREDLGGLRCYRRIEDLPAAPDASFVGINRHATVEAVRALAARGAGGAVCFASGFAEAADDQSAGKLLQAELVAAAGEMPILGPNCYGLINYVDGALLWPDQHGGTRVDRGVAILGQSSNMLINLTMQRRGLPVAFVVAAGNQAQTGLADMACALVDDPRVSVIGLHIEGVSDIRAFETLAVRARAARKPVVALKVGRSDEAQRAAFSHTASLAGGDAASRAFLSRLGIPVLASLSEFLETLMLAHVHGALPGRAIGSISCSGGEASLIADAAVARDVHFPDLTDAQHDQIKATLSELVTVSNPLDYHTFIWGDVERMTTTYAAMMRCDFDLAIHIYDLPRPDNCDETYWQCGVDATITAQAQTGARVAMVSSLPENMPEQRAMELMSHGIAPLHGLEEALAAVEALADVTVSWQRPTPAPILLASDRPGNADEVLDEGMAKQLLARHGLSVPASRQAGSAEEAARVAASLGFPVALKGLGIAHKTEAGAVALNLTDESAVRAAATAMPTSSFLVEAMVGGAVAELIVGVVRDPVYGFTLTIGAGGILTELLEDSVTLLLPVEADEIRSAVSGLRVSRLLAGYRGKPAADIDALVDAVLAVQRYAVSDADMLLELDVNPLIATPHRAVAVDALIRRLR